MVDVKKLIYMLDKASSEAEVRSALDTIIGYPILAPLIDIHPGSVMCRVREVKAFDEIKRLPDDLSFRKDIENITKYGRANLPKESIFYATYSHPYSPYHVHSIPDFELGSFMETLSCFNTPPEKLDKTSVVLAVSGLWRVKEKITLFSVVDPNGHFSRSESFKSFVPDFPAYAADMEAKTSIPKSDIYLFSEFMSKAFKNNDDDMKKYWITANLSHDILVTGKVDGLAYESVKSIQEPKLKEVLCFAISPLSVLEKLEFIGYEKKVFSWDKNNNSILVKQYI